MAGYLPITALGFPFQLIDERLQIFYQNYLALLLAGLTVLSWAAPRFIQPTTTDPLTVDLKNLIPPNAESDDGADGDLPESR
jgi:hypothetical protein